MQEVIYCGSKSPTATTGHPLWKQDNGDSCGGALWCISPVDAAANGKAGTRGGEKGRLEGTYHMGEEDQRKGGILDDKV